MMIARLRGIIEDFGSDGILVDTNGVGYLVQVSTRTRAALPGPGGLATLLIEMQLREDSVTLFGFVDREERDWFRTLTTVQGVGGKVALNILSVVEPDRLAKAILGADKAMLSRADGVGPKLAIRLVTELKDKAAKWSIGMPAERPASRAAAAPKAVEALLVPSFSEDAVSALVNLGYRRGDALSAVTIAERELGKDATMSELIRASLRELAP